MKVSIVTVVYNGEKTISTAIESVLNQSYQDIEYIIVDGNSSDRTKEIVTSYQDRISKFVSEPDKGIYDGMNKGLALCTGDLVGTLNADDLHAHENVIENIVSRIQETGSQALYADLVFVDPDTHKLVRYWKSGDFQRERYLYGFMPPHPTFFVRRECYEKYGTFDLSLVSSADYELMLRLLYRHEISCAYLDEITILMRTGGQSNASLYNRLRANFEDMKSWGINGVKPLLVTTPLKFAHKIPQFFRTPDEEARRKLTNLKLLG